MPEITNENKEQKKKTTAKSGAAKKTTTKKATETKKATTTKKATSTKASTTKSSSTKSTAKTKATDKKTATSKSTAGKSTTKKKTTAGTKSTAKPKTTTKKTTATKPKETAASKAVKEAREKVATEVKETLKQEVNKPKDEPKKENKKEETIIQKIKNFIAKIIALQEEAFKESENKKALTESIKEDKENDEKARITIPSSKYMLEYYDLPYRYNETVVKILAQTPRRLFVYWDISDDDRQKYQEAFGQKFFEDSYPVLLVHNEEKNYTFEVPINDFANSWYLDINDPKSKYVIQLGRKFKTRPEYVHIASTEENRKVELYNDYVPITTSNVLEVPNDHILFENLGDKALYRNVKTNEESYLDIANSEFMKKMGKVYSVYDLYKEIYKNELGDGSLTDLLNPSSMSSSGTNSSMFR